jgi:nitroimidazol reductase NimA-like FMN-containing flavoprotein (pyridoxamine 5'-phosphate oxidase superfamily)
MLERMEIDRNGLEVLDRPACLRRLASATIGRISLTSGALPTVLPVNFVLTPEGIVFRTGWGTKLDAATHNTVVAFEVDDFTSLTHGGWSVVVTGVARELTDPEELESARALPLAHWANRPADRYVCISLELVSGRALPEPGGAMAHAGMLTRRR